MKPNPSKTTQRNPVVLNVQSVPLTREIPLNCSEYLHAVASRHHEITERLCFSLVNSSRRCVERTGAAFRNHPAETDGAVAGERRHAVECANLHLDLGMAGTETRTGPSSPLPDLCQKPPRTPPDLTPRGLDCIRSPD